MGPRDPSPVYPFNLLDLVQAAAWAPPNLPLFAGLAPARTPMVASVPAGGAAPWLRPLHEVRLVADTLSPNAADPASGGDPVANPSMSGWSAAPGAPAGARPYPGVATSNSYLGSFADADQLDPARTRNLLADAKRRYDFADWISSAPSVRSEQPIRYAAAADAPRTGAPTTGIADPDDQLAPVDRAASVPAPRTRWGNPSYASVDHPDTAPGPEFAPQTSDPGSAIGSPNIERPAARIRASAAERNPQLASSPQRPALPAPQGDVLAPRMISFMGNAGPANAPEGPSLISLAQHNMVERLRSPLPAAPAASQADEWTLTNKASWDPRTWSLNDNPLAWLQLDYERKHPAEAERMKHYANRGDVLGFDAPRAKRRTQESFARGYGEPILDTEKALTEAGPKLPDWARPQSIALARMGLTNVQAADQALRGVRGVATAIPGALTGLAEDLGIVDSGVPADKLQGELGILMQYPGNPELMVLHGGTPRAAFKAPISAADRGAATLPNRPGESIVSRPVEPAQEGGLPRHRGEPPAGDQASAPADAPRRRPTEGMPGPDAGSSHIAEFRARIGVPTSHTLAVGRTNVPGLEGMSFEGASPHVWQEAGLPPPSPGKYKSPSRLARDGGHAEEGLFNQFDREVQTRGLRPSDIEGKVVIRVSNPHGVCTYCRAGLDNPNVAAGIIKQFSLDYPKLTIEFSVETQSGIRTIGPCRFTVRKGTYINRNDR